MADVRPFRAIRPRDDLAGRVIAPPYDVISEAEARAIARERLSFVRVTRSEVDLSEGADAHGDAAYAKARENLDRFVADGTLVEDPHEGYLLYGQTMGEHAQIAILAACSVPEYDAGRIRKHEFTRPDKEDDRTHHMEVLDAQVGLVFLAYRSSDALGRIVAEVSAGAPRWRVTTDDGVIHALWSVPPERTAEIQAAFAAIPELYIADGHHRSAAASRVYAKRRDEASKYFLAGIFPADDLQVMAYNRVVHDLNGRDPHAFVMAVRERFELSRGGPKPAKRGEIAMYLGSAWHTLRPKSVPSDPVGSLDVSVLQDQLLGPILGIDDPRRSTRIRFVGGIRGPDALAKAVDAGGGVAFSMFPTGMDQLFAVADQGDVMPPKSTWFEPKLREGVAIRRI
jgi:uncharacterized protein (DUF1015 family)